MSLKKPSLTEFTKSTLLTLSIVFASLTMSTNGHANHEKNSISSKVWHQILIPIIEAKAKKGNAKAQVRLGMMLLTDDVIDKDNEKALYWLEKGAINNPQVQWILARLYSEGYYDVAIDERKAFEWRLLAARSGVYGALKELPSHYRFGWGTDIDYEQSFYWQKKLVESEVNKVYGMGEAELDLAAMYYCGMGTPIHLMTADKFKNKALSLSVEESSLNYVYGNACYEVGEYELALPFFQKSAELGVDDTQFMLGYMYDEGIGVTQDYLAALKWYVQAAEQNNIRALNNLAILYEQGNGVDQNYNKAKELYQQAAKLGSVLSYNNIGEMYENGLGVPQDYSKAREYYLIVVREDEAVGFYNMGHLFQLGRGVKEDLKIAKEWYQQACDKGYQKGCDAIPRI